ncbi:MAG: tetratricopeptide repeat protein [Deltaproteobacteria bacterium]|nr:tetratricopeptide repeat protein [Deltaproteobacteria bacterium]
MAISFHDRSLISPLLILSKKHVTHQYFIQMVFIPFIVCSLLFIVTYAQGQDQTGEEIFFKANLAYNEGRYQDAIEGYHQLIRKGYRSGQVYFNLGNAYFREEELGKAILFYERAKILLPRDADLNFNLGYALDQTQDAIPKSSDFITQTFFWINNLNLGELFLGFALLNIVLWGILLIRLFIKPEWTYYGVMIFLIPWSIAGLSFGLKWYQVTMDDRAVVLQEQVNIMAGPHSDDTVLFQLHEGAVILHERVEDEWALIRLPDNKRGWVKNGAVEKIIGAAYS